MGVPSVEAGPIAGRKVASKYPLFSLFLLHASSKLYTGYFSRVLIFSLRPPPILFV